MPCVSTLNKASDANSSTRAVMSSLRWHYPDQVRRVGGAFHLSAFQPHPFSGVSLPLALFFPGTRGVVVAVAPTTPAPINLDQFKPLEPLCAFPRVALRYYQPQWPTVVRRQLGAVVPVGDHDVVVGGDLDGKARRVIGVAMRDDVVGRAARLNQRHQVFEGDALPVVVEPAPGRYAVHISRKRRRWQFPYVVPGQRRRGVDLAVEAEPPASHVIARRAAVRQHRPLQREHLSRREADLIFDDPRILLAGPTEKQPPPS